MYYIWGASIYMQVLEWTKRIGVDKILLYTGGVRGDVCRCEDSRTAEWSWSPYRPEVSGSPQWQCRHN